jgi:ribosomal protein S18 acetylase RimI-like enzyme
MHPLPAELQIALERHGQRLSEVDYRLRRPAATGRELPPLPPELEFRDVDERIEVAFRELIVRAFAEGDVPLLVPTAAEWRRSLLAATPPARALFQRGELLGGVSLRHEPGATIGEISTLARDPTARGRGVGELLVAEGCRVLASRGALTVELGVCSDNLPALDLYRRCGFELARESHTYAGHAADAA